MNIDGIINGKDTKVNNPHVYLNFLLCCMCKMLIRYSMNTERVRRPKSFTKSFLKLGILASHTLWPCYHVIDCAMNPGTCTAHNPPYSGQMPQSAVSSHRSWTEIGYHMRPVGEPSGDLLQKLEQHAKQKQTFSTKFSLYCTKYILHTEWSWSKTADLA
jgi:hypothetical protein